MLYSGDVIFKRRVLFLNSPATDINGWLQLQPHFVIPGDGAPLGDVREVVTINRDNINYVHSVMCKAVAIFVPFDELYMATDLLACKDVPVSNESNHGNTYRIYLEMEAESFR